MRTRRVTAILDGATPRGAEEHGFAFNIRWNDLVTYNSEVRRGIVHTPEWDDLMVRQQAVYNQASASPEDKAIWTFPLDQIPGKEYFHG